MLRVVGDQTPADVSSGNCPSEIGRLPARACIRGLIGKQGLQIWCCRHTTKPTAPPCMESLKATSVTPMIGTAARSGARARGKLQGLTVDGLRATGRCDLPGGSGVSWFQRAGEPRAAPSCREGLPRPGRGSRWVPSFTRNSGTSVMNGEFEAVHATDGGGTWIPDCFMAGSKRGPIGCPVAPSRYGVRRLSSTISNNRRHQ